jgi:hypothetical protein
VVAALARVFDELGVRYLVGGSFASSLYGVPRSTQDVDLVAELRAESAQALYDRLSSSFYVDVDMIRDAVARRASFNVIHLETMFKADVFIMKGDSWSREEMTRAKVEAFEAPSGSTSVRLASPEDTLLHKLVWYKLGSEISERQAKTKLAPLACTQRSNRHATSVFALTRSLPLVAHGDLPT